MASVLLIAVAVFAYAGSFTHTVVNTAMAVAAVAIGVILVCLTGPLRSFWRWVSDSDNPTLTTAVHYVAGFILLASIVLMVNDLTADYGSMPEVEATITGRSVEVRHKKERVGRHRYRDGQAYNVYILKGRTPDGTEIDLEVNRRFYNTHREGDTFGIHMGRGTLGLTVYRLL